MTEERREFEMCFELSPKASWRVEGESAEEELVRFAERQIRNLLGFVTLYQNGRVVAPDAFAVVNSPQQRIPLATSRDDETGSE